MREFVVVALTIAAISVSFPAAALKYVCTEAGDFAMKMYDVKKEGHSLSTALELIKKVSGPDIEKATLLQGIAIAIYGDNTLTRIKAYEVTNNACNANR